ncbi:MAG: cache domain-containing protein [Anaerolineae bacterium]|nr:cache domain-containing protein [Anaerolineae bacterium]
MRQFKLIHFYDWWRGFPLQLFLITILPLTLLVILVAFGSQNLHHEAMRSLIGDRDLRAVRAAAGSIELEIMHRSTTIQLLARSSSANENLEQLLITPEELAANFDGGLALFDINGNILSNSTNLINWSEIKSKQPAFISSMTHSNSPVFSAPWSTQDNELFIMVGSKTAQSTLIVGAFSPAQLVGHILSNSVGTGQTSAIIIAPDNNADGFQVLYLAGPDHILTTVNTQSGFTEPLNGDSGINYYHAHGEERVLAFSPINPPGWGLITEEAWEDISTPYLNPTQSAFIFAGSHRIMVWRSPDRSAAANA